MKVERSRIAVLAAAGALIFSSCSGKSVKKTAPELSRMEGKKVALVGIDGEETARSIVEVALVNQLVRTGTFEIISKQNIQAVQAEPDVDPTDWETIARRAGADYALRAKVLEFIADTHKGYSEQKVYDSQMAEETGNGDTTQLYKVKRMDGRCEVQLQFTDLTPKGNGEVRTAIADRSQSVTAEAKESAAHLPPRLTFLEGLCNDAFHDFFEKYK